MAKSHGEWDSTAWMSISAITATLQCPAWVQESADL